MFDFGHISVENSGKGIGSIKLGQRVKRVDSSGELASKPRCYHIVFFFSEFENDLKYISKLASEGESVCGG